MTAAQATTEDPHLLVVDDDERLRELIHRYLAGNGYRVTAAANAADARALMKSFAFDLLVLDVMMPGENGFELTQSVRENSQVPILILTAKGDAEDRIQGLELGADDYLPKPFEPRELLARIQTILRRRTPAPGPKAGSLHFEGLEIDLERRSVQRQGEAIELTGTEFELLVLLAGAPRKVYTRDDILAHLRGHAAEEIHSRAVDILVSRLRRKLAPLDVIHTLRNAGYLFAGARA